ncbi:MAG: Gfo/Idh/MocA family oxidoreductase [Phycisphaerae bacterium]|nr:Gfo/Idh/MocA family oxidoreductase [Phycisphaerae bacterium]
MARLTRREFVKASTLAAATAAIAPEALAKRRGAPLRAGVVGCGGRGTGAAVNFLEADSSTRIVALADVFEDRIRGCRSELAKLDGVLAGRGTVADERCYVGFDGYQRMIEGGNLDVVILATPPGFRPSHIEAAVGAGLHVFTEKPVGVDGPGIRRVIAAANAAKEKGLSIVAGTQRRHESSYLATMKRLRAGAIGRIVSASCYWNQGGLWMNKRQASWSDMEWQLRNWLYFAWLSGDHIVEQHVHNLDAVNWALGATPTRCTGMGGRQVRTSGDYGHIFDHFAVEYEYPGGVRVTSMCRQIEGCASKVEEVFVGTEGTCVTSPGRGEITGKNAWKFEGENPNPYVQEHKNLVAAIASGQPINEGVQVAHSTLTAIMGRMSAYTGKVVTWEQALNSTLDLVPAKLEMGPLATPEVAVPGRTPLV